MDFYELTLYMNFKNFFVKIAIINMTIMDDRTAGPDWSGPVRGPDFWSEILFGPVRGPDFGPDFRYGPVDHDEGPWHRV